MGIGVGSSGCPYLDGIAHRPQLVDNTACMRVEITQLQQTTSKGNLQKSRSRNCMSVCQAIQARLDIQPSTETEFVGQYTPERIAKIEQRVIKIEHDDRAPVLRQAFTSYCCASLVEHGNTASSDTTDRHLMSEHSTHTR